MKRLFTRLFLWLVSFYEYLWFWSFLIINFHGKGPWNETDKDPFFNFFSTWLSIHLVQSKEIVWSVKSERQLVISFAVPKRWDQISDKLYLSDKRVDLFSCFVVICIYFNWSWTLLKGTFLTYFFVKCFHYKDGWVDEFSVLIWCDVFLLNHCCWHWSSTRSYIRHHSQESDYYNFIVWGFNIGQWGRQVANLNDQNFFLHINIEVTCN